MNSYTARHVVFGGVLILIATNLYSIGLGLGLLAIVVPTAWLLALLLVTRSLGTVDLSTVALSVSMAMLLSPIFVYVGEGLNNIFASLSGPDLLTYLILRAGVLEELLKFTAAFLVVRYFAPEAIKHPADGMIFACSAALGFAVYENFYHNLYFALAGDGAMKAFLLGTLIRVPMHALYAAIWGAAFGISRFLPAPQRYFALLGGLAASAFIHGFWDTLAQSKSGLVFFVMLLLYVALWYGCVKLWHRVRAIEPDPK